MSRKIDKRRIPKVLTDCRASPHPTSIALEGGDARKRLSPLTAETILLKVSTGMTVKQACVELGLSPGLVNQRRYDDPEDFGARMRVAKEVGADTLADSVLEYALRSDLSVREREVIIDALKWLAKVQSRHVYGDKLAVDATHSIAPVMLPTIALPSIPDGEFRDVDPGLSD